ncbi:MAG: hypothetical protein LUH42_03910 [Oscillospiraceae bacterium]|nr:hypothetical protein [Oscillospiraceae bacterium]
MKEKVIVRINKRRTGIGTAHDYDWKLEFYLVTGGRTIYLFTQDYTKGVYEFFRNGRSVNELRQYRKWNRNPRLDKTIEKIPLYRSYVLREIA